MPPDSVRAVLNLPQLSFNGHVKLEIFWGVDESRVAVYGGVFVFVLVNARVCPRGVLADVDDAAGEPPVRRVEGAQKPGGQTHGAEQDNRKHDAQERKYRQILHEPPDQLRCALAITTRDLGRQGSRRRTRRLHLGKCKCLYENRQY